MNHYKTTSEARRDGFDRCRIRGCHIPMSPNGAIGTCGNQEIDKPIKEHPWKPTTSKAGVKSYRREGSS